MNEDIQAIVQAIESLKNDGGLFKNYLFPVLSSFFSAILGAVVAYFTLRFQENIQIERTKLDICNKWTIEVEGLFQSLIAFKANYASKIGSNPIERAVKVKTILNHSEPLQLNFAELSFVTPKKNSSEGHNQKWRQVPRVRGLIENYNTILRLWEQRNFIERPLRERLISAAGSKPYADFAFEEIISVIGERNLASLIDLTEKAIHLTDDIIIESNDFLNEFPGVAKAVVDTKRVKRYGTVLKFETEENQYLQKLICRVPEVDFEKIAEIYGTTISEAQSLYNFGY